MQFHEGEVMKDWSFSYSYSGIEGASSGSLLHSGVTEVSNVLSEGSL